MFWPGGFWRDWGTEGDMGSDEKQSLPGKSLADALGKQPQDEDDLFGFSKQPDPVALSTHTRKVAAQYILSPALQ